MRQRSRFNRISWFLQKLRNFTSNRLGKSCQTGLKKIVEEQTQFFGLFYHNGPKKCIFLKPRNSLFLPLTNFNSHFSWRVWRLDFICMKRGKHIDFSVQFEGKYIKLHTDIDQEHVYNAAASNKNSLEKFWSVPHFTALDLDGLY